LRQFLWRSPQSMILALRYARISRSKPAFFDAPTQPLHQDVVVHPVKELGQVHVHYHALAPLHIRTSSLHRIVRTPPGAKPVADFPLRQGRRAFSQKRDLPR
jgi:hypothetical protein